MKINFAKIKSELFPVDDLDNFWRSGGFIETPLYDMELYLEHSDEKWNAVFEIKGVPPEKYNVCFESKGNSEQEAFDNLSGKVAAIFLSLYSIFEKENKDENK